MSISELTPMRERARRIEVFTGAGRRRNWAADEKAAIVAERYAPGPTVCGVARRRGPPAACRVPTAPALFGPAVTEAVPGLPPPPASRPRRARQPGPVMGIEV